MLRQAKRADIFWKFMCHVLLNSRSNICPSQDSQRGLNPKTLSFLATHLQRRIAINFLRFFCEWFLSETSQTAHANEWNSKIRLKYYFKKNLAKLIEWPFTVLKNFNTLQYTLYAYSQYHLLYNEVECKYNEHRQPVQIHKHTIEYDQC